MATIALSSGKILVARHALYDHSLKVIDHRRRSRVHAHVALGPSPSIFHERTRTCPAGNGLLVVVAAVGPVVVQIWISDGTAGGERATTRCI